MPKPIPEFERKRELESLRLASELVQLAKDSLDPALKAHFQRMAKVWTTLAEGTFPFSGAHAPSSD